MSDGTTPEEGRAQTSEISATSHGLRSIQNQLLLIALLPILIILPVGLRGAANDMETYRGEQDQARAVHTLADLTVLEESLRAEWLAGLDLSGLSSNSIIDESELASAVVAAAFTEDVASNFASTIERTDAALVNARRNSSVGLPALLDDLDSTRERIRNERVIPAEVDLYFTRLLAAVNEERSDNFSTVLLRSSPRERRILDQQSAIASVATGAENLQRGLTQSIDSLISDRPIDWPELAGLADDLVVSIESLPVQAWSEPQVPIIRETAFDVLRVTAEQERAAVQTGPELATVLSVQRSNLVSASGTALDASSEVFDQLIDLAAAERRVARNSLVLSGILVSLALAVGLLGVSRGRTRIARPLRATAEKARRVLDGEIPRERTVVEGPIEVQDVSNALGDLVDTIATVNAQAQAITSAATNDESLSLRLPGKLGRTLERSIGSWRETTLQLEHEVSHDPLTNLASPRRFVKAAHERAGKPLTLALISLDGFKAINDTSGRQVGDEGLVEVARRFERQKPEGATLARLWSDEFALLGTDRDEIRSAAIEMMKHVRRPLILGDNRYRVSATIGIATDIDLDEVVRKATVATREGKVSGGDQCVAYDTAFAAHLEDRAKIEGELIEALNGDPTIRMGDTDSTGLRLWLQPVIDTETGRVKSIEALARWHLSDGSIRMPDHFVPIAEQSRLSLDLDVWVIRAACSLLRQLSGTDLDYLDIAVNISGRHLSEGNLVQAVEQACEEFEVASSRLSIEVTESYLVVDLGAAIPTLRALDELGVTLLLDDFGTGYSSLSYLQDLPFQVLKIDRSFVQRATQSKAGESIVVAIVGMGHALGLTVLAEGVETKEQARLLASLGCDQAQGFGISRPTQDLGELFILCRDFDLHALEREEPLTAPTSRGQQSRKTNPTDEVDEHERPRP